MSARYVVSSQGVSAQHYRFASDQQLLACLLIYVGTIVFEGPLRWGLHMVGGESLLYVRDLLALAPAAVAVMAWFSGQASAAPVVGVLALLLVHLFIGLLSLPAAFQAVFGFKVWFPLLLGLAVAPLVEARRESIVWWCRAALLATALGVLVNIVAEYPWIGLSYDTAFGETGGAKQWWTGTDGALRLPGLTRSSVTAATICLLALPAVLAAPGGWWRKSAWVALGWLAIYYTTSKGPLMAVPGLIANVVLLHGFGSTVASALLLIALTLLCVGFPLTAVQLGARKEGVPDVLHSFVERMADEWPRAFRLLSHEGQALWGRGLGGIGTAQSFGEWSRQNAGDNLMVYLIILFGALGPLYVGACVYRLIKFASARDDRDFHVRFTHGVMTAVLVNGFTAGTIEDAVACVALGVVLGIAMAPQPLTAPFSVQVEARASVGARSSRSLRA